MSRTRSVQETVAQMQSEIAALRGETERVHAALYDVKLDPPQPAVGKDAGYRRLTRRIREVVREALPRDACIAVVSKGDDELLDLYGRVAWHFPQAADGRYGGYYPKRSLSVIAHLETLRARGADYLLFPATALWWLDEYPNFRAHLAHRYRRLVTNEDTCIVYSLAEQPSVAERPTAGLETLIDELSHTPAGLPTVLDWGSGLQFEDDLPDHQYMSSTGDGDDLPYLDATLDVVVTRDTPEHLAEARRVASRAVVRVVSADPGSSGRLEVERTAAEAEARSPSISIIIPCHDGAQHTEACLRSLLETLPQDFEGEILTVDDATSDQTNALLRSFQRRDSRVLPMRNRRNLGFLGSCSRAARESQAEYLLFLNNDTVLLPGWLSPLARTFGEFPAAGVVGGRLLYPDGRLQEAGGCVFADGSAWKFGYGDPDPEKPLFRYVREVDYVSGALLMTPRRLFESVGGFDAQYGFGFYEDDDYCFAVRAAGSRVYYQPASVIVHVEGASAGLDLSLGAKQHQAANQHVFVTKWAEALALQPQRPDPIDERAALQISARGCRVGEALA